MTTPGNGGTSGDPGPPQPALSRNEILLATGVLSIAPFLSVLDLTLTNIILPHIAGGYGATPTEATLVVTFFAVSQAIAMPLTGALAQRFGVVRMFVFALTAFAVSSFLCGAAPSLPTLATARVLQGLSAGPIVPLSQAILQRALPQKFVAMGLTVFGVAMMSGPLVGPALGGLLADSIGWRWGFFVNIPIALVCVALSLRILASHESPRVKQPVDGVGLVLMITWVAAIQVVLDKGREWEWFDSQLIVALSLIAAAGFVAFLAWELTESHPIVDLSVFRHRSFAVAALVTAVTYAVATGGSLLVYVWLQTSLHYPATTTGYIAAITGTPGIVLGALVAWLSSRVDMRWLATFGLVTCALAMIARTNFAPEVDFFHVTYPQVLIGISAVFFWGPLINIAMGDVPREKIAAAAGLLTFTRTLALGLTVALLTTFWEANAKGEHARISGTLNDAVAVTSPLEERGGTPEQSNVMLNDIVDSESLVISMRHMFYVLASISVAGAVLIWFAPVRRAAAGSATAFAAEG